MQVSFLRIFCTLLAIFAIITNVTAGPPSPKPTRSPTASPTTRPTRAPTPTSYPTFEPTNEPSLFPTQSPTTEPTLSPVADTVAATTPASNNGQVVAIVVSVWVVFCACAAGGYYYYRRLQKKIAESDAHAGDYIVTSEDSNYDDEAGVTKFVNAGDGVVNPLQMAGTTESGEHNDNHLASAGDDEEFLADEDLL